MRPLLKRRRPDLSVVVIVYNMRREAPRTLFSLSTRFQRGVTSEEYEVLVMDNGSRDPLDPASVAELGPNFRYLAMRDALPSPARAVNVGVEQSRSPFVGIMIDGARIASPGVIHRALQCLRGFTRPVVGTMGFHLGPDVQSRSISEGYDQKAEDQLLQSVAWRDNGYRLFEICALAGSSKLGWFKTPAESNLVFLPKVMFEELGGFDERFDLPGGGLVNLDFFSRASELEGITWLTLLGEATFHQVHGGISTNAPADEAARAFQIYARQYQQIRGVPYVQPDRRGIFFGEIRPEVLPWLKTSCDMAL